MDTKGEKLEDLIDIKFVNKLADFAMADQNIQKDWALKEMDIPENSVDSIMSRMKVVNN